jgi:hypothetical protein
MPKKTKSSNTGGIMAKPLSHILAEIFDTGDERASTRSSIFERSISLTMVGSSGIVASNAFVRVGGKYADKNAAIQAAKVSAL